MLQIQHIISYYLFLLLKLLLLVFNQSIFEINRIIMLTASTRLSFWDMGGYWWCLWRPLLCKWSLFINCCLCEKTLHNCIKVASVMGVKIIKRSFIIIHTRYIFSWWWREGTSPFITTRFFSLFSQINNAKKYIVSNGNLSISLYVQKGGDLSKIVCLCGVVSTKIGILLLPTSGGIGLCYLSPIKAYLLQSSCQCCRLTKFNLLASVIFHVWKPT